MHNSQAEKHLFQKRMKAIRKRMIQMVDVISLSFLNSSLRIDFTISDGMTSSNSTNNELLVPNLF